jgi:hypothetical protein
MPQRNPAIHQSKSPMTLMINYIAMSEVCATCNLDCEAAWIDGTCPIVGGDVNDVPIDEKIF